MMTRRKTTGIVTAALAAMAAVVSIAPSPPSGQQVDLNVIVRRMDDLYRSKTSRSEMSMTIVTPHWERTLEMTAWTKGLDETFIRIHSPRKEQGVGTLRIKREMWNYLPKVNKIIKIPPSMMSSAWMGSDFTNDDLVSEVTLVDDYDHELTTVDSPQPGILYVKHIPHEGVPVVWAWFVTAVAESDTLPVWEKYYDDHDRLMRTLRFSDIKTFDGRTIPSVMEMIPEDKEGHKTVIRYDKVHFDTPLGDDIFTLRNLRSP